MDDVKYKEDKADPQVNINGLNEEFNISTNNIDSQIQDIKNMKKELRDISKDLDGEDPDKIILDNIDRANRMLDLIETDICNGERSARMFEVVGQLINAITTAATSITGISYNQQVIDNKNRALDIKEKELTIKGIVKGAENVNVTNNNLIMTREELLKMINES